MGCTRLGLAAVLLAVAVAQKGGARARSGRGAKNAPKREAIPQAPGDPAEPILPLNSVLQLPDRVIPRSANVAPRRRAILVTDGQVYQRPGSFGFLSEKEPAIPYAYVLEPDGKVHYTMEFGNRKNNALPYGIAEDPSDGRVAVTFFQAQNDNVELWSHDLSMKLTYHDTSLKPTLPLFQGTEGTLWVPYGIADRFLEETDKVLQLYIYEKDGQRVETFPRREWVNITYPHSLQLDKFGRMFVAGMSMWPYDDGVFGPTLKAAITAPDAPVYTRIEVYRTTDSRVPGSPYVKEQRARWEEQHPGVAPSPEMLETTNTHMALQPIVSYAFPFPVCVWPLLVVLEDGHAIAACYDSDQLSVIRLFGGEEEDRPDGLRRSVPEIMRITRPLGIKRIGALALDPSGKAFIILDRERKRVYSAAWPIDEARIVSKGTAAEGFHIVPVTLSWHDQVAQQTGVDREL